MASPQQVIARTRDRGDLTFPLDFHEFHEGVPFFVLNFMKSTSDYVLGKTPDRPQKSRSIVLPLPQTITDSSGLEYNTSNLNVTGHAAISAANRTISSTDGDLRSIVTKVTGEDADKRFNRDSVGSAAKVAAHIFAENRGGLAASASSILTRESLNPHLAVLFHQVELKNYSCAWSLSPASEDESTAIADIIRAVNYHSHPSYASGEQAGHLLHWPDIVQPSIENSDSFLGAASPYIFKPASVTRVDVDYTPSGGAFHGHPDGAAPVITQITMNFNEIQIVTREDYES